MSSQPIMLNGGASSRSMFNPRWLARAGFFGLSVSLLFGASLAYGQSFTMSIPLGLDRPAVDPGGSAIATIDLTSTGGFSSPVSLTCAVSSGPVATSPPFCTISPSTQVPPADGPSLTITTTNTTTVGLYGFTVTGTSGSIIQTLALNLTVQPLSEDYTLLASPITAVPNPVAAGATASTTVTISPIGSYSGHQVTLACLSITPVVTAAPVCSFQPTAGGGSGPVKVTAGTPATATLILTTFGPTPVTRLGGRRIFYAFWLAIPALGFVALSTSGVRRKGVLSALLLILLGGGVLLMPACGSSSSTTTISTTSQTTPKNTYTFTLTGADENGAGPSNNTTNQATVSLTVN